MSLSASSSARVALANQLEAHAVALLRIRVPQQQVRGLQRHFRLDDAARHARVRVRLLVLLDHVDALDQHLAGRQHGIDGAAAALVLARGDDDFVALPDLVHARLR
jgi:hypothetical protein